MTKKTLFLILASFFLIRVFLAVLDINYQIFPHDYSDFIQYNDYALSILKNFSWLYSPNFLGNLREPLYPLFLAFIYLLFGKQNLFAIFIFQAIISTVTIYIIYRLALRIFGKTAAVISLFLAGLNGYYLYYVFSPLRETLNYFLIIVFFYFLFICLNDSGNKKKYLFGAALSFFLLVHTDSRYLYFLPCSAMLFFIFNYFKKGLKKFLVFLSIVIILSIPWAARNYVAYKNFVLINTAYFNPGTNFFKTFKLQKNVKNSEVKYYVDYTGKKVKSPLHLTSMYWFRLQHFFSPAQFNTLSYANGEIMLKHSLLGNICSIFSYGLLLPFLLIAIFDLRKRVRVLLFFLLPLFFHTILHVYIAALARYRVQMDSFLIILAGQGIALVYLRWIKKQRL